MQYSAVSVSANSGSTSAEAEYSCGCFTYGNFLQAANYLDIKGLLDVTCKTVANMIKGKTPEEIRKTFNIKNDFTEEEEAQVLDLGLQFSWVFCDERFCGTS